MLSKARLLLFGRELNATVLTYNNKRHLWVGADGDRSRQAKSAVVQIDLKKKEKLKHKRVMMGSNQAKLN